MSQISYLECPNEIMSTIIHVEGKSLELKLPICPICKLKIKGYRWFQALLSTVRMHTKCFFESVHANQYYIEDFYSDTYLARLQNERKNRWKNYVNTIKKITVK